ncbi:hypothetical protein BH20VER3_BH20VER3_18120 [soil metagenome]
MGSHIVKTTIEIADDLFAQTRRLARREKTTLRALTEQGLRLVLQSKQAQKRQWKWKPRTSRGQLSPEFRTASWDQIREEIYGGEGA